MKLIDHVRVNSAASGIAFTNQSGASLEVANTMVRASAEDGWGVSITSIHNSSFSEALALRNSTIVTDGAGSAALQLMTSGQNVAATSLSVTVNNSIVRGAGVDVSLQATWAPDTASVLLKHSNFETGEITGQGTASITDPSELGNQTALPLFTGAAAGDLRQAPGSPTIDAGVEDVTPGQTDIEGDERFIGASIDIGADEFVPPPPAGDGGDGGSGSGDGGGSGSGDGGGSGSGDGGGSGDGSTGGDGSGGGDGGGTAGNGSTGVGSTGGASPLGGSPAGGSSGGSPSGGSAGAPRPVLPRCVVPRLSGKTLQAAKAALIKAHCRVGKVKKKHSAKRAGRVLSQSRKAGARVRPGTKIALVLSRR
jgi:hypothetical protein